MVFLTLPTVAEGPPRPLVEAFVELSQALVAGSDADALLEDLVGRATETVAGCDFASVSLLGPRRRVTTPVASDPLAVELDELQYETHEGPCLEAVME